jgi:hypothetical protein
MILFRVKELKRTKVVDDMVPEQVRDFNSVGKI